VGAEVPIPAYEAMKSDDSLGDQVLNVMMRGVSTRNYKQILPDACDCVGVSRSSISREFVEASEQAYKDLLARKFDNLDLLILYIDGIVIGGHNVLVAIGIDSEGCKHVLGMKEGAEPLTAGAVREFCAGRLSHFKIPRYVHVADAFPMTVTGKIRKVQMREESAPRLGLE